jgi:hypothetical protein
MRLGVDVASRLNGTLGPSVALTGVHPGSRRLWLIYSRGYQVITTDGEDYARAHPDEVIVDNVDWCSSRTNLLNESYGIGKWKKAHLNFRRKGHVLGYLGVAPGMAQNTVELRLRAYHPLRRQKCDVITQTGKLRLQQRKVVPISISAEFYFKRKILADISIVASSPQTGSRS